MQKDLQKSLVKGLTDAIRKDVCDGIDLGHVPEDWDGHQLRKLLADLFSREVSALMKDRRRLREYRKGFYAFESERYVRRERRIGR